jgi:hypothetical protein
MEQNHPPPAGLRSLPETWRRIGRRTMRICCPWMPINISKIPPTLGDFPGEPKGNPVAFNKHELPIYVTCLVVHQVPHSMWPTALPVLPRHIDGFQLAASETKDPAVPAPHEHLPVEPGGLRPSPVPFWVEHL